MLFSRVSKGYCRFCEEKCRHFKVDKKNPHLSKCKLENIVISRTTPTGKSNVRAPHWCPKR